MPEPEEVTAPGATRLRRDLGLASLAAVVFFNVSGGPYGIEDAVSAFGPGLALLLLVLTPLVWSLPVTLFVAELSSALPDEGGYASWVRRAFGPFWGFQVGWWSWIGAFVDVAVYPALFADYLKAWIPETGGLLRWAIAMAFIWSLALLNIRGVRIVGWGAVLLGIAALLPVGALVLVGAGRIQALPWEPFVPENRWSLEALGLGAAVMMWNYSGWDNPSTCLGETRAPERNYRRALWWSLPLISLAYLLPVGIGLGAVGGWERWTSGYLPAVGAAIGGAWLGGWLTLGALLTTAGQFLSILLTNSRLPFVLAWWGQLPGFVATLHPRYGTPWVAIVSTSAILSLLAVFSFQELIKLDVWLYSLALFIELAAFLALRIREPGLQRPWRVPGGLPGALIVVALPCGCILLALATAGLLTTLVAVAVALTGPLVYVWAARRSRR
jgi:amino acid transporter